jgi:hypothetical protein
MAESPSSDLGFRNREEDWPDPDVDLNTEEGEEVLRRNETSLFASMNLEARNQWRAVDVDYDNIPASLYDKARDYQDQLTEAERQRFLNRGDAIGKALAYPDSLTPDEFHEALGWPLPEVVRASIQRATSGRLSTPAELYAEAQDALDHGRFDVVSDDAAFLIAHDFYTQDDYSPSGCMAARGIPGYGYALDLLSRRHLSPDLTVWKACASRSYPDPKPRPRPLAPPPPPPEFAKGYLPPGVRPPWLTEPPLGPFPVVYGALNGYDIFQRDSDFPDSAHDAVPAWIALPEDQKESYRARAETRRREAWADYETSLARKDAGLPGPPRSNKGPPPPASFLEYFKVVWPNPDPVELPLSGFEVFRNELVAGDGALGFGQVLVRWEALTDNQRMVYEMRARDAERAAERAACGQSKPVEH